MPPRAARCRRRSPAPRQRGLQGRRGAAHGGWGFRRWLGGLVDGGIDEVDGELMLNDS